MTVSHHTYCMRQCEFGFCLRIQRLNHWNGARKENESNLFDGGPRYTHAHSIPNIIIE